MKKILFGVFAHPDDEGFGPSGTFYLEAQAGTEVNLILVTDGAASTNQNTDGDLAHDRLAEWRESAKLIGATHTRALGYGDGQLSNSLYLEIAEKIIHHIVSLLPEDDFELSLMTFESGGISGHIDHIAVSYITTYVYLKLREKYPNHIGKMRYFCLPESLAVSVNTNWLYMPKGKSSEEIDETIDISNILDKKLEIMKAHKSQKADMETILKSQKDSPDFLKEHFIYFKD